tara:strand:+ start:69 stop:800 length:732 start_codon:yes stop_codon:yes gene_type:complete
MGIKNWAKNIGKKTLYFPGQFTRNFLNKEFENYQEIFKKLKINFITLEENFSCGHEILSAGYKNEARKLANKNFEILKKNSIKKIITNSPSSYYMFKNIYPEFVREWDIEVEHSTISILNGLKKIKIKPREKEIVTYHDSCKLGRYSEIYEEPREAIKILGGEILEMKLNRENSLCCCGGAGMQENFKELSKKMAQKKISTIPPEVSKIISSCELSHSNLKSVTEKSTEFSTFVLGKLRGLKI